MIVTVTQLNNYIKGVVDMDATLADISVHGEVTNVKNAHNCLYFSLKDENAQIDCFSYANDISSLPHGMQVVATGNLNFLTKSGRVSFFVKSVRVSDKIGEQYLKLLALQHRLQQEGLFDVEKKKPVPSSCRKIGVVTSRSGAVIRDIQDVVFRRQPYSDIFLYPVHVQGLFAEGEIVSALRYFSESDVDVVILARGGGSNEDLSVFNAESVVRSLFACQKPTVSAVGHGVDFTLCDFTADRRAVTPSEAAELVTLNFKEQRQRLLSSLSDIAFRLSRRAENCGGRAESALRATDRAMLSFLRKAEGKILQNLSTVSAATERRIEKYTGRVEKCIGICRANDPLKILSKGFSLVEKEGKTVVSAAALTVGDSVRLTFADGKATATITGKEE